MAFPIDMMRMARKVLAISAPSISDLGFTTGASATTKNQAISPAANSFVLVALCHKSTGTTADTNPSLSGNNSGAASLAFDLFANSTNDINFWCWTLTQGATPDTSLAFTGLKAASNYALLVITYTGCGGIDVATQTLTGTSTVLSTAPLDPPAITPVTSNAKVLAFYAEATSGSTANNWSTVPPELSHWTEAHDPSVAPGEVMIGFGDILWGGSGAVDPTNAHGNSGSSSSGWAVATMALKPG